MGYKLITAPAELPVTVDELKIHFSILTTGDELLLGTLLKKAVEVAETMTTKRLITQTWEYTMDFLPPHIVMPYAPLQSITSIKYIDTNGTEQTLASNKYKVDNVSIPGRVYPAYGVVWPMVRSEINSVTVRFVCGYASSNDVPSDIKSAIMMIAYDSFRYRGSMTTDKISIVSMSAEKLLLSNRY